jgi:hypothetical protein
MRRTLLAAAASLVVACSVLTSFDGIAPREAPPDAASDAGADVALGDASVRGCAHTRWPDVPPGTDTGRDIGQLVTAVTQIHVVGPINEGRSQGFDLDQLCTCPEAPSCVGSTPGEPCDVPETGIDNAGENLFRTLAGAGVSLDDMGLLTGIERGQYGVIVRIEGYDGELDDPDVKVAFFNAVTVNGDGGDGGVPRNDGTDSWTVDTESLLDGRFPAYFASRAYVSGGILVADFARLVLRARIPSAPQRWSLVQLELQSAHLVARLGPRTAKGVSLADGTIAGRTPAAAILAQGMRSGACRDSGAYEALKPLVCASRDLALDPSRDGRDLPCDALSLAIGFAADPALIAPGSASRTDEAPCPAVADDCP